jgi:hypothetical protein
MTASAFEDAVLDMCGNDYEAPHTIAGDLARELARQVSEPEVRQALLSLASKGLVQAYVLEARSSRYVPVSSAVASETQEAWFMATGKKERT